MAPKEVVKKPAPQLARFQISSASLYYIPNDTREGFHERLTTGIDWTLIELAARHHKKQCAKENPALTFTEALNNKIDNSIFGGILKDSNSTLKQQWEIILPMKLWDVEKFANEAGQICFNNANNITNDMVKMVKRAVALNDRNVLTNELKMVNTLRVNDSKMTGLDKGLKRFKKVVSVSLCGNFISDIDAHCIPASVRSIELQGNFIKSVKNFADHLSPELLYLGLARNMLNDESIEGMSKFPHFLTVLDLSDNDIYELEPVLGALAGLPNLSSLMLAGNPCSVCMGYSRHTLKKLKRLVWLDCREVLSTDTTPDTADRHPDDLRSGYFNFTVFRVMSAVLPPKPEKGVVTTFHIELQVPLLDSTRRQFLMYHNNESLLEMLPPPEDDDSVVVHQQSTFATSHTTLEGEISTHESDVYKNLTTKNSREICHFTTFESNRVSWSKIMNFTEPALRIFCPDLVALRDTFRSVITLQLIYSLTPTGKSSKVDKKSSHFFRPPVEQRVVLATIKCALKRPDWSQTMQHFHWDDSLNTKDAIHWGDGDLSILQYSQAPVKTTKTRESVVDSRQTPPNNLTCHFGFGIDAMH